MSCWHTLAADLPLRSLRQEGPAQALHCWRLHRHITAPSPAWHISAHWPDHTSCETHTLMTGLGMLCYHKHEAFLNSQVWRTRYQVAQLWAAMYVSATQQPIALPLAILPEQVLPEHGQLRTR